MLEAFAIVTAAGLRDDLAAWASSQDSDLIKKLESLEEVLALDTDSLKRFAWAITNYLSDGFPLMNSLSPSEIQLLKAKCSAFRTGFLQALRNESTFYNSSLISIHNTCGWSSMPMRSKVAMAYIGEVELVDDFAIGLSGTSPVRLGKNLPARGQLLSINSKNDWLALVKAYPKRTTFIQGPVRELLGDFFIPDWVAIAKIFESVQITIEAYLSFAYTIQPVADLGYTQLSGWHPGSRVFFDD